jgi:hypothetical protein
MSVANLRAAFVENDIPWPRATLFFDKTGPLVQYSIDGVLSIEDLNPEVKTQWRMSRRELFVFGWRCIRAAMRKW